MSQPRVSTLFPDSLSPEIAFAIALPTTGIVLSESLLSTGFVTEGLWGYMLTLLACTLPLLSLEKSTPIFAAFVLFPVFRLVNLTMPVFVDLTVYWLALVYFPFAIAGGLYLWQRGERTLNWRARLVLPWLGVVLSGGVVIAEVELWFGPVPSLIPESTDAGLVLLAVIVVLGAVVEEMLFRGILQSTLQARIGPWLAIAVASIVFTAMRIPFGQSAVAVGLLAGLCYGVSYAHSESLVVPVVFHGTANVLLFVVYPTYGSIQTVL